jgi:hypothetical protein
MNYNFKLIVPRVAGDDKTFKDVFEANLKNITSELAVYNIFDDPKQPNFSIFQKYNKAIDTLKKQDIGINDLFIFCHNDVGFLDNLFKEKIENIFEQTNIALVGFVGTSELIESGCWWNTSDGSNKALRGHLIQGSKKKLPMEGIHLVKGSIGFFDDVVGVDGLCMVVSGKAIRDSEITFDTETFKGNHFYDLSFCLDLLLAGYDIAVADILLYHQSEGASNVSEEWTKERDKFVNKYKTLGLTFPITKESIKVWRENNGVK